MGKYITVISGAVFIILGITGIIIWRHDFINLLKGCVPPVLLLIGLACYFAGLGEIKDAAKRNK